MKLIGWNKIPLQYTWMTQEVIEVAFAFLGNNSNQLPFEVKGV